MRSIFCLSKMRFFDVSSLLHINVHSFTIAYYVYLDDLLALQQLVIKHDSSRCFTFSVSLKIVISWDFYTSGFCPV